ncbi:YdcF family protein [Aquicoccus sp. SU-CL01552]|uniref:YdcF family protein n=1 Tax=Aquicoccus sp. SU-CL01552 TaxID=3127656 RepID=UPI003103CB3B
MDTLFFVISKLVGFLIRPESWIIAAVALTTLAIAVNRRRLALATGGLTLVFLLTLSILPLGEMLLRPIESEFPVDPPLVHVDGIIVLGGAEDARATAAWGQPQLNEGAERFTAALALARRFPEARVLFTGGSSALRSLIGKSDREATVAARFFATQGLIRDRLILEGRSRNTAENAKLSLKLVNPDPDQTWVLVTSAFHMKRAMRSFANAGWAGLVPYPVDFRTGKVASGIGWNLARNLTVLNTAIKENIGLMAYRFAGK